MGSVDEGETSDIVSEQSTNKIKINSARLIMLLHNVDAAATVLEKNPLDTVQ